MTPKQYPGPFGGIVDDVPRPYKAPGDFDDLLNFFVFEGRLQTRPRMNFFITPPDDAIVRDMISYQDVLNNWHSLFLTTQNAYALTANPPKLNLLTAPQSLSGTGLPYGWAILNGKVFFSNGSAPVMYTDGEANLKIAGDVPGAARYMSVLASHLLTAYTTEPAPGVSGSFVFSQRVRWSASGNPLDWTSFSAGFNDLLDVPDFITGLVTLGRNAYVFRTNGVTTVSPTGIGGAPFFFDNISIAPIGIGCPYPYTLATFGSFCVFVSRDDVYMFEGQSFTPIGLGSRKKIFTDIANSSGDVLQGFFIPALGANYPYLSYWLSIPNPTNSVSWVWSRTSGKWQRFQSSRGEMTSLAPVQVQ